jgi:hypothetical protein
VDDPSLDDSPSFPRAKLYEILLAQHRPALMKNLGGAVFLEAVVLDESATHTLLLDVATTLGDQGCKDRTVVGL